MKKLIAVLLSAAMLAGSLAVTASAEATIRHDNTFMLGDANGDTTVNAKDSLYLKGYISKAEGFDINVDASDINADGEANAKDSLLIKASLAKQISLDDYDTDKSIYSLTIGKIDISEFCVVVPDGSTESENVYYAAQELIKYIDEIYETNLQLCVGEANATSAHKIIFHGLLGTDDPLVETLGHDGYLYEVSDGNMNIYGELRGNMYAVYDILEKYTGYRFYSGEETFIYKTRSADIADGTSVQLVPETTFRFSGQTFGGSNSQSYYYPRKQNGTQIYRDESNYRLGCLTGPHFINAHSFLYYYAMGIGNYTNDEELGECKASGDVMIEEYNKTASKPMTNTAWQPCGTSDDVYNILFTGMLRTMTMIQQWGHTFIDGLSSMSFSINDNLYSCNCRYCTKKISTEGISGLYVDLTNRAARDIKSYYPAMKLYTIIYDHTIPQTVRPESNVIIMFCGTGCNQHFIGSGECGTNTTVLGGSNTYDEKSLKAWGQFCKDAGAEMWFWYYPVTYAYYLIGCPNIVNIYYDYQYLINECNCTGIYYEGGGRTYNFEALKAYMSAKMMWDPTMTYDEFTQIMMEYLYMYYGAGAEEIYQYIMMQDEAGNESGTCFVNNYDRPGEMYSYTYIAEHYEEMRALLVTALGKTVTDAQTERIKTLIICCDFLGLSASYDTMYTNGTAASIATYKERYDNMYNRITSRNMDIFCNEIYVMPSTIDYSVNPMIQYYEYGSRRVSDTNCPWGTGNN